ncbi:MAG: ChaN family lipoprotein [Nitrospirota bacterium]
MNYCSFLIIILFLPLTALAGEPAVQDHREHRLDVAFEVARSRISGSVTVPVRAGQERAFRIGHLAVSPVSLNGRDVGSTVKDGWLTIKPLEDGIAEIRYEGTFKGGVTQGDRNYGVVSSTIDERGISLTGTWYPQPDGLARWKVTAQLPAGYEAISEAETITREKKGGGTLFTFDFPHPVDGLSLVATDRYEITRDRIGTIELFAYFFKEDRELARSYLQYAKNYIEQYEKLLSPYPYKRFSIVENFLPTGYSLPTFTLLGQDVVRLPFIVETSLGHEILHQWFGNSVYVDDDRGNWCEGLTTYLADHRYEEQKGKGAEYRKQLLVNYAAYVNEKNETTLREFRSRTDLASRAIGYGKAAMVFHMLRTLTGDEQFFASLKQLIAEKQFRAASWDDIKTSFEKRSGKDLSAFFKQWLDGKGLPEVRVEHASVQRKIGKFEITIDAVRTNSAVPLDLPVTVSFLRGGEKKDVVVLDADKKSISILADEEPVTVAIDGAYDLARKLTADEMPPVIARLLGDAAPVIVAGEAGLGSYQAVVIGFVRQEDKKGDDGKGKGMTDAVLKASNLVVLGADNPVLGRLFGATAAPTAGFSVEIRKNPWNPEKVVGIFHSASAGEADAAFPKISHYGKYSSLAFVKGKNVDKKISPSERGIIMELREEPPVVDLSLLRRLSDVIASAAAKKIVYVGEYHDRFSNHSVQLQIIRALYARNTRFAIGMEMFQRPFQKTLDDYVSGAIDEREFLSQVEYYKRWGFDYNLYKPILDFARQARVPVVALNLRKEITEKVSKEGMDALTDEERKELPRETDFSDEDYRHRIRQVFDQHKGADSKNFDFFLQAQVLWDETMAESIDAYFKKNPDHQMAVIAGGGHLVFGTGIPKRTFRRNGLSYTIILNDVDIERDIADFVIFPQPLDGMTAPKLMATFKEENGRILFNDFVQESPARAAGIRADDLLVSLDGVAVKSIPDIKTALFFKNKGDSMKVKVVRKRFLLGEKEMEFEVKL